ncbi:MAG: hypothetical protein AVDCRST_MAG61-488, partial [uncultured Friedmanniella sp.]
HRDRRSDPRARLRAVRVRPVAAERAGAGRLAGAALHLGDARRPPGAVRAGDPCGPEYSASDAVQGAWAGSSAHLAL